jgi:hypothetical protein
MKKGVNMKEKFVVMDAKRDKKVKRFNTEAEALAYVEKGPPADLMCDVEWYIRKIWTNARDEDA